MMANELLLIEALRSLQGKPSNITATRQYNYAQGESVNLSIGNQSIDLAIGQGKGLSFRRDIR